MIEQEHRKLIGRKSAFRNTLTQYSLLTIVELGFLWQLPNFTILPKVFISLAILLFNYVVYETRFRFVLVDAERMSIIHSLFNTIEMEYVWEEIEEIKFSSSRGSYYIKVFFSRGLERDPREFEVGLSTKELEELAEIIRDKGIMLWNPL